MVSAIKIVCPPDVDMMRSSVLSSSVCSYQRWPAISIGPTDQFSFSKLLWNPLASPRQLYSPKSCGWTVPVAVTSPSIMSSLAFPRSNMCNLRVGTSSRTYAISRPPFLAYCEREGNILIDQTGEFSHVDQAFINRWGSRRPSFTICGIPI